MAAGSVIVGGARTPFGKLLGGLASVPATELGGYAIAAALARAGIGGDQVHLVARLHSPERAREVMHSGGAGPFGRPVPDPIGETIDRAFPARGKCRAALLHLVHHVGSPGKRWGFERLVRDASLIREPGKGLVDLRSEAVYIERRSEPQDLEGFHGDALGDDGSQAPHELSVFGGVLVEECPSLVGGRRRELRLGRLDS